MFKKSEIKYGDILWVEFDPSVGHEFQDKRPALVIQTNKQLLKSNLITFVPFTTNIKNKMSDDIFIEPDNDNNLRSSSIIKVYDIVSFDFQRVHGKIGKASENIMLEMKEYLKIHFGL
jgi:mRNA interferase MazF